MVKTARIGERIDQVIGDDYIATSFLSPLSIESEICDLGTQPPENKPKKEKYKTQQEQNFK